MDTAIWILSKIIWALVKLDNLLLFSLVLGSLFLFTGRKSLGRKLVTISSVIILVLTVFPLNSLILLPLENRFPIPEPLPKSLDGIIVLSGAENLRITHARSQPAIRDSAERLTTFVGLSRRYPNAKLVFTGGAGSLSNQEFKSVGTAQMLFEQLGLVADRVQFEFDSRTTFENGQNSYKLMRPKKGEKWVLITSARHMPRAVGVFRKVGWQVIPYPVDYSTTGDIKYAMGLYGFNSVSGTSKALHEWAGIVAYWLMGRTSELLPGPN